MTSTQSNTPDTAPERPAPTKKQIWIDPSVHGRLRRRVAAELAMGREETLETLATKLLARALDDLPQIPHIPPAA